MNWPLFFMFLSLVIICVCVWIQICNHRTHETRMQIVTAMSHRPLSYATLGRAFDSVPYDRHMFRLLTFRNALALYPPVIREALANPHFEGVVARLHVSADDDHAEFPSVVH